jgi:chemotaxis protein CheD
VSANPEADNLKRVEQGGYAISAHRNDVLSTTLGSCIAVCMHDPFMQIGGMNHFVLPEPQKDALREYKVTALRYGSYSIERLVNEIIQKGGLRERLEVKVFGGADLFGLSARVGQQNVDFVTDYLARENLRTTSSDLGGRLARRVRYWPATGRAMIALLRNDTQELVIREKALSDEVAVIAPQSRFELF